MRKTHSELGLMTRSSLKTITRKKMSQYHPSHHYEEQEELHWLLRKKINSYINYSPGSSRLTNRSNNKKIQMTKKNSIISAISHKSLPFISSLELLIKNDKQILLIFREKMQANCEQFFIFFMQILECALKHQYTISSVDLNKQKSVLIDCLIFVAEVLQELGHDKLALFFAKKTIQFSEIFLNFLKMGQALLVIGKIMKKMARLPQSITFLKKSLQYIWFQRKPQSDEFELQIYDQLSHIFLQMNKLHESKIFAKKYQIGYVQKQNSKVIELSRQLVLSALRRKPKWHCLTEENVDLILSFSVLQVNKKHRFDFSGRIDQNRIMEILKLDFNSLFQLLMRNDIFFSQMPLPLQIIEHPDITAIKTKLKHHPDRKFVPSRAGSLPRLKVTEQKEKVQEQIIFNYRGVSFSRIKLATKLTQLLEKIKQKLASKTKQQ